MTAFFIFVHIVRNSKRDIFVQSNHSMQYLPLLFPVLIMIICLVVGMRYHKKDESEIILSDCCHASTWETEPIHDLDIIGPPPRCMNCGKPCRVINSKS